MEYELFRSKLKPLTETGLLSKTIRNSSSGADPHRAAAMELIFEKSIQERCERMLTEAKGAQQSNHVPQPKKSGDVPDTPAPKARTPAPAPAPAPQPLPTVGTGLLARLVFAAAGHDAPPDPPTTSKATKEYKKVVQREGPPPGVKANPPPPEGNTHAECPRCNTRQLRSQLHFGIYCNICFGPIVMRCSGCKTTRAEDTEACNGCQKKFK